MIDHDDVVAVQLDYALRDLVAVSMGAPDSAAVWQDFFITVSACIIAQKLDSHGWESILLQCARATVADFLRLS